MAADATPADVRLAGQLLGRYSNVTLDLIET